MSDETKRLVDAYQDKLIAGAWSLNEREALDAHLAKREGRIAAVGELLAANGCDCDCEHHPDEHGDDCELCLACRISDALGAK